MNNYRISSLSLGFIVICLIDSTLLGIAFPYIIRESTTSFVFSLIISFIIGLLYMFVFIKIFDFMPEKNIIEKIETIFPKVIAKIVNSLMFFLVFLVLIIIFYRFSTFISSEYLTETPAPVISILLAGPLFYAMFKDIDTAARCATIIIFTIIFLFIFSRITLLTQIDLENFKPIVFNEPLDIIKNAFYFSTLQMVPLFLALMIPKNNITDPEKITKHLIFAYLFSYFIIVTMLITIVGLLGVKIASLYTFPSYVVLKNLNILNFIKNVENFSVLFWIMFMSFTTAICLVFMKNIIYTTYKIKNKRKLNISMIILFIAFIITIIVLLPYENYINKYKNLYANIPFITYLGLFILVFISYIIGKIMHKKST